MNPFEFLMIWARGHLQKVWTALQAGLAAGQASREAREADALQLATPVLQPAEDEDSFAWTNDYTQHQFAGNMFSQD